MQRPCNNCNMHVSHIKVRYMQVKWVYKTKIRDVAHLKERLIEEWTKFDQIIIDGSINQWRKRLRACVAADGGHFEQKL